MSKSFAPVVVDNQEIGQLCHDQSSLFFFGNRLATLEILKSTFSEISFKQMRQVHGNKLATINLASSVVSNHDDRPEADALWTSADNTAPVVSTADCLPILVGGAAYVCSIHAGWRGILNQIIVSSLQALPIKEKQALVVFIGPHILKDTFEFDREQAQPFLSLAKQLNLQDTENIVTPSSENHNKVTVDLTRLARAQIQKVCPWAEIVHLPINTYVDSHFCSFRREHIMGRNLSFVARLKA